MLTWCWCRSTFLLQSFSCLLLFSQSSAGIHKNKAGFLSKQIPFTSCNLWKEHNKERCAHKVALLSQNISQNEWEDHWIKCPFSKIASSLIPKKENPFQKLVTDSRNLNSIFSMAITDQEIVTMGNRNMAYISNWKLCLLYEETWLPFKHDKIAKRWKNAS